MSEQTPLGDREGRPYSEHPELENTFESKSYPPRGGWGAAPAVACEPLTDVTGAAIRSLNVKTPPVHCFHYRQ